MASQTAFIIISPANFVKIGQLIISYDWFFFRLRSITSSHEYRKLKKTSICTFLFAKRKRNFSGKCFSWRERIATLFQILNNACKISIFQCNLKYCEFMWICRWNRFETDILDRRMEFQMALLNRWGRKVIVTPLEKNWKCIHRPLHTTGRYWGTRKFFHSKRTRSSLERSFLLKVPAWYIHCLTAGKNEERNWVSSKLVGVISYIIQLNRFWCVLMQIQNNREVFHNPL